MKDFNDERDNNEMNSTENNQNANIPSETNNVNNNADNTENIGNTDNGQQTNHAPVSEENRAFGQFINNQTPNSSANQNTGSYSYTGDKLTDSKTNFSQPHQTPSQNSEQPNNTVYNMPHRNGNGEISYSPSGMKQEKPRKEKKKAKTVSFTRAGVAVLCCATICLSAAAGFMGAFAASSVVDHNATVDSANNGDSSSNSTAVMYRSVSTTGLGSSQNGNLTYKEVANLVQDSVVEIVTEYNTVSLWFQYVSSGAGSGVILSQDGYIITNNHVIYNESSDAIADNITVRLRNGEEYKAEVIGADSDSDIAVLKIEAEGLTPAVCGNSDSLAVGEEVLAVGNPLGELGGTVTNGIVSATDREIDVGDVTMNLIQTNAAVNPGNSGGGLFNMNGELVGIVNAKSSGTDVEGLGFAIPVNDALNVAEQLLEYGYVRGKVMIGVSFLDATDSTISRYYGLKSGIYVSSLTEGYNDQNLKPGDRVIAVNGNEISAYEDISSIVKSSSVGDILNFQVYRDGKLIEVNVEVFEKIPESTSSVEFESETAEETQQTAAGRTPW